MPHFAMPLSPTTFRLLLTVFALLIVGVLPLHAQEPHLPEIMLNANPSFETEEGWNRPDWLHNGIEAHYDNEVALHGKRSLRFDLLPDKPALYWQSFSWDSRPGSLRCTGWIRKENVRGTTPVLTVEFVLKVNGKDEYKYAGTQPTGRHANGFQEYAAILSVPQDTFALRLELFTPQAPNATGRVWYDAVSLEKVHAPDGKLEIEQLLPGGDQGVYLPEDAPPELIAIVGNGHEQTAAAELRFQVWNCEKQTLFEATLPAEIPPLGSARVACRLPKMPEQPGYHWFSTTLIQNGEPLMRQTGGFILTEKQQKRDPFFGVTGYGFPDKMVTPMAKLGAGSCGYLLYFAYTENPRGTFHLDRHVAPLALRRDHGYRIIGAWNIQGSDHVRPSWLNPIAHRDMAVPNATCYSQEYIQAYADYARQMALFLRDKADEISLVEEIDIAQHLTPLEHDSYLAIVKASAQAIRDAAPELPVTSVGTASPDFNHNPPLEAMAHFWNELHPYLDGIAFDGYMTPNTFGEGRVATTPERNGYRSKLLKGLGMVQDAEKKLFSIDEAGWAIVSATPLESPVWLDYAAVLQRTYILSKSVPGFRHYLFFKVINGIRAEDWYLFGDFGDMPTPAAAAYGVVAHNLAFAEAPKDVPLHRDIHAWTFRQGEKTLLTIWSSASGKVDLQWRLSAAADVSDFMGRRSTMPAGDATLTLTGRPLYLWFNAPQNTVCHDLSTARFELPELQADFSRTGREQATLALRNLTDAPLTVFLEETQQEHTIAPNQMATISVPVDATETATASCRTAKRRYLFRKSVPLLEVPSHGDGALELTLDRQEHLHPVDAYANGLWTGPEDLSVKIALQQENGGLHLVATVRDDVATRERDGASLWGNDCIQFAIHPNAASWDAELTGRPGYTPHDWEFGMALTPKGPQLFCYQAADSSKRKGSLVHDAEMPFEITPLPNGDLRYEVRIPWQWLRMKGAPGEVFGFSLLVMDSDRSGQTSNYWMALSEGIANGKAPEKFPRFILK